MSDVDITICGAGPVGMVLACLLVQRGVAAERILLLDAKSAAQSIADPRSIAISHGSQQILQQIGAWPITANLIEQIHVSRRGHFGRTLIDRSDYALPALGYVTRYGALVSGLLAALAQIGIVVERPRQVIATDESAQQIQLHCDDGTVRTTGMMIQAEGGIFSQQSVREQHRDYQQSAIVTHITCSSPLMQRAFERFTAEGPLALLPQEDGYAVVWCARSATANRLQQLDDALFLQALEDAFGTRVGKFLTVGARTVYPLGLNANVKPTARSVAIGNAAQSLHPVAGQGLNLGLRDAMVLAKLLARDVTPAALSSFSAQRRTDRGSTIRLTDTMARIFASAPDGALSQSALGAALGLVDAIAPLKRLLAEQMMFGRR